MALVAHSIQLIFGKFKFSSPHNIFVAWADDVFIGTIHTHQEIAKQLIAAFIRHRDFMRLKFWIIMEVIVAMFRTIGSWE